MNEKTKVDHFIFGLLFTIKAQINEEKITNVEQLKRIFKVVAKIRVDKKLILQVLEKCLKKHLKKQMKNLYKLT